MLNSVCIQGNLTRDPDLRRTASGKAVLTVTVAINRDKAESESFFIPVVAWEGTAEFITSYFKKGQQILVDGHLQSRNYDDKDGKKRTAIEVVADRVYFTGGRKQEPQPSGDFVPVEDDEDLPF